MKQARSFIWIPCCILCILIAACGTSTQASSAFTQLTVHRDATRTSMGKEFPALNKTVTDAASVKRLYNAAQNLPVAKGAYNCPVAFYNVQYKTTFYQDTKAVHTLTLIIAGCRFATLDGDNHIASDAFLKLFQQTLNLTTLTPDN